MVTKFIAMGSLKDPKNPESRELLTALMKDLREITGAGVAFTLVAFLLSCFLLIAVVHAVAMGRKGGRVTLGDQLRRIRRTWEGLVITKLYVTVISFGLTLLIILVSAVALTFVFTAEGSITSLVVGVVTGAATLFSLLMLVYLEMVWQQSLVISVVEEDCYGLAALGRASELIRGRRRLGFWVNFCLVSITGVVSVVYFFVDTGLPAEKTDHVVAGLVMTAAGLLMDVFTHAVGVAFYNDCKKERGEEAAMKGSFVYTKVPTAPTVDEALP